MNDKQRVSLLIGLGVIASVCAVFPSIVFGIPSFEVYEIGGTAGPTISDVHLDLAADETSLTITAHITDVSGVALAQAQISPPCSQCSSGGSLSEVPVGSHDYSIVVPLNHYLPGNYNVTISSLDTLGNSATSPNHTFVYTRLSINCATDSGYSICVTPTFTQVPTAPSTIELIYFPTDDIYIEAGVAYLVIDAHAYATVNDVQTPLDGGQLTFKDFETNETLGAASIDSIGNANFSTYRILLSDAGITGRSGHRIKIIFDGLDYGTFFAEPAELTTPALPNIRCDNGFYDFSCPQNNGYVFQVFDCQTEDLSLWDCYSF